jgi:hypothetical protein
MKGRPTHTQPRKPRKTHEPSRTTGRLVCPHPRDAADLAESVAERVRERLRSVLAEPAD